MHTHNDLEHLLREANGEISETADGVYFAPGGPLADLANALVQDAEHLIADKMRVELMARALQAISKGEVVRPADYAGARLEEAMNWS